MKRCLYIFITLIPAMSLAQAFDTAAYEISIDTSRQYDHFFTHDPTWRGADGAASIDMGNGRVLWLFSDSFIAIDSPYSRRGSKFVRNSIAIQQGYDLEKATLKFYWNRSGKKPGAFFGSAGKRWFWTGHGAMIKDRLIIFLMKEKGTKKGLGFEAYGWSAVLVSNPGDDPVAWKMKYIDGSETFGTIAGSGAILTDSAYLYAFGAVEPSTHEVYILRWKLEDAYGGNLPAPEWWIDGTWTLRNARLPVPRPSFIAGTEYSVHYDPVLKKFIQVQSFGFGEGKIGLRMADRLTGPWTEPYMFYTPVYPGVKKPFMYSAKTHPELSGDGLCITYNVNSFDFRELVKNQTIYFPLFVRVKIRKK